MVFDTIHFYWRKKNPVRKLRKPFGPTAYTGEFLNIIIPGLQVLVADGPIYSMTIFQIGIEIQIAQPVTLASPGERPATYLITPNPMKGIILDIRMVAVIYKKLFVGGIIISR